MCLTEHQGAQAVAQSKMKLMRQVSLVRLYVYFFNVLYFIVRVCLLLRVIFPSLISSISLENKH